MKTNLLFNPHSTNTITRYPAFNSKTTIGQNGQIPIPPFLSSCCSSSSIIPSPLTYQNLAIYPSSFSYSSSNGSINWANVNFQPVGTLGKRVWSFKGSGTCNSSNKVVITYTVDTPYTIGFEGPVSGTITARNMVFAVSDTDVTVSNRSIPGKTIFVITIHLKGTGSLGEYSYWIVREDSGSTTSCTSTADANCSTSNLVPYACLYGCTAFEGEDLSSYSSLEYANFTEANLTKTIFTANANLTSANFTNASLTSATLRNASLIGAILTSANFTNASLIAANLTSANLTSTIFQGADLQDAIFSGVDLTTVILTGANLGGAFLTDVTLTQDSNGNNIFNQASNVQGISYSSGNLSSFNLANVNLTVAYLNGTDFTSADLTGAIFTSASLKNANFQGANLTNTTFEYAILQGATFSGTLTSTNFTNAYFYAGTISSNTSTTITVNNAGWTVNEWQTFPYNTTYNYYISVNDNSSTTYQISSNSSDTLTLTSSLSGSLASQYFTIISNT